ncbi:hypothetical protein LTR10_009895 [Elasticomyces elasticus]|nr:hypothetical protein LTR10_009895 [Elasticomyces elasticus]KAK4970185.1 hypothetical protein LTR42_008352 [Elasticomyces elasticus]
MEFILVSLVSMTMLATALPTVDTVSKTTKVSIADFGTFNSSNIPDDVHANTMTLNTTTHSNFLSAGSTMCYGCGNGVDEIIATHAIDIFCKRSDGIPRSAGLAYGYQGVWALIDYYANSVGSPTGQVVMTIYAMLDEGCEGTRYIDTDRCISTLGYPISHCDDNTKHGGSADADCLFYSFSPNPNGCARAQ